MRSIGQSSRARGFNLMEMLFAIALAAVVMLVSSRQFRTIFQAVDRVPAATEQTFRYDAMMNELRRDVWQAERVVLTNDRTLALGEISWTIADDGAITRSARDGSRQWPIGDTRCRFVEEGGTTLLRTRDDAIALINPRRGRGL